MCMNMGIVGGGKNGGGVGTGGKSVSVGASDMGNINILGTKSKTLKASEEEEDEGKCLCESAMFVQVYDCYLQGLISSGDCQASIGCGVGSVTPFHALSVPNISPCEYVQRLLRFAHCSNASMVAALIYVKRIEANVDVVRYLDGGGKVLDALSVHRLLLTCLVVAVKVFEDEIYDNKHYAGVGGLSCVEELNALELLMLKWVKFDLSISAEEFKLFEAEMVDHVLEGEDGEWVDLRCSLVNMGFEKVINKNHGDVAMRTVVDGDQSLGRCSAEAWSLDTMMNVACN